MLLFHSSQRHHLLNNKFLHYTVLQHFPVQPPLKTIFELPSGYELLNSYPTNKLTSNKTFMFFNVSRNGSLMSCGLYNNKGKLVQSFANGVYYATVNPFLYRINGNYKLLVWKGSLSGTTVQFTTDIYNFKAQDTQIQSTQESKQILYPSRTNNTINIPYSNNNNHLPLLIVDGNGIVIESQQLSESDGIAHINVGIYRPGVYIYKIGEQTGKFVVN